MEPTNETTPAEGDSKIEKGVYESFDKSYHDLLKKDQDAIEATMKKEAIEQFENVRKLGFATKSDIEDALKGKFEAFISEIQAIRKENTEFREWAMRAKSRGMHGDALDDQPKKDNNLRAHERFKW